MVSTHNKTLWFKKTSSFLGLLLLLCAFSHAQGLESLRGKVTRHRLNNGLTFLLMERHTSPTISFHLYYDVGSVNEHLGQTGIAHLYEHMAFKGTQTIGTRNYEAEFKIMEQIDQVMDELISEQDQRSPDAEKIRRLQEEVEKLQQEQKKYIVDNELGQLYERHGATGLNATTQMDATEYFVSLPANKLELWARIESDRMAHTVLRQFYSERDVVMEERRRSVDTQPFGKLYENFIVQTFVAHPYGQHSGIGWEADLRRITRKQTEDFYRKYYTPANTFVSIVGDFKTAELVPLLEKYFSSISAGSRAPRVHTVEPPQQGERQVTVEYPSQPFLFIGYHRPDVNHPDDVVFDVIESILSSGRTSRLYKSLIEEKKVAVQASARAHPFLIYGKYPSLFLFVGVPLAPHTPQTVKDAILAEIELLKTEPVSQRELQKTLNKLDAAFLRGLRSNAGLARTLVQTEALTGNWETLLDLRAKYTAVKPEDILRVARQYFTRQNRTIAFLQPPADTPSQPRPASGSTADDPKAREKLLEVVAAHGGSRNIQAITTRKTDSQFMMVSSQLKGIATSLISYPEKTRTEISLGPQQVVQILNHDKGWLVLPGGAQPAPPHILRQLQISFEKDPLMLLKMGLQKESAVRQMDPLSVAGRPVGRLLLFTPLGREYQIHFDLESGRLTRVSYKTVNEAGQETEAYDEFEDFREVGGIQVPFTLHSYHAAQKVLTQKITRLEFNVPLEPSLFEPPAN
ncbi:MAG: insulinase family protein [Acidobacteria bacterium]|nr:insulinase family protein [Acidobacteriota bacterium]